MVEDKIKFQNSIRYLYYRVKFEFYGCLLCIKKNAYIGALKQTYKPTALIATLLLEESSV